jgi:hypothetical protein
MLDQEVYGFGTGYNIIKVIGENGSGGGGGGFLLVSTITKYLVASASLFDFYFRDWY